MSNRIKEEFLQKSEPVRLNKYLSEAGVCSRREADRLIETGRVTVDGQRAQTGMRIVPGQVVKVGNNRLYRRTQREGQHCPFPELSGACDLYRTT